VKRVLIAAVAASALAGALPATALARHHHARHGHKRHAHRARSEASGGPSSTTSAPSDTAIGKVASFENGVLTITLNDNSTLSGKVTSDTDVNCEHPGSSYGVGGEQTTDIGQAVIHLDAPAVQSQDPGQNQDQGDCDDGVCGPESLVKGADVIEAEVKLSSLGVEWKKVEVVS
jgi:hypothetical protein